MPVLRALFTAAAHCMHCVFVTYAVYVLFFRKPHMRAESGPGGRLALVSCSSRAPLAFDYCKSLSALLLFAVFAASQQGQCFKACVLCSVLNQLISMLMNSTCAGVLGHTCLQQSCRHLLRLQLAAAAAARTAFSRLHQCPASSSCMLLSFDVTCFASGETSRKRWCKP